MQFEWDEQKNALNIQKHGIDFNDVPNMFDHELLEEIDDRYDYGEERLIAIGVLRRMIAVVVYVERRGDVIRIISARRANRHERQKYRTYLAN